MTSHDAPIQTTMRLGSRRVEALVAGDPGAPVALLLHGFPDHPPSWIPVMQRLAAAGYRAVAPWSRGYYPTSLEGPYDTDQLAADAIDLALQLSPERPVALIGHDWGAITAYVALARAPQRFAAAVTLAVPHLLAFLANLRRDPAQLKRSWYIAFFQLPALPERVVPGGQWAFVRQLWRTWSPGYELPADQWEALTGCLERSMPAPIGYYRALAQPWRDAYRRMSAARGQRIEVPTLVLHGADDGCIGPRLGEGQERFFRGPFASQVVPEVGHFLQLECPDEITDLVVTWCRAHGD